MATTLDRNLTYARTTALDAVNDLAARIRDLPGGGLNNIPHALLTRGQVENGVNASTRNQRQLVYSGMQAARNIVDELTRREPDAGPPAPQRWP